MQLFDRCLTLLLGKDTFDSLHGVPLNNVDCAIDDTRNS
jgi:hypothetical protein